MKDLYLNTLRDTLTGDSYGDCAVLPYWPMRRALRWLFPKLRIGRKSTLISEWRMTAKTMTGRVKMDVLRSCLEDCIQRNVPGAVVECGVWRGGSLIYAAGVLRANDAKRKIFACDSFEGLPAPTLDIDKDRNWHQLGDFLAVSVDEVRENFRRFGLLDENVHFIKGWFKDSLPGWSEPIMLLRCDGDTYQSTMDILNNLYSMVSPGGIVMIDDWFEPSSRAAVERFLIGLNCKPKMHEFFINRYGKMDSVWWEK